MKINYLLIYLFTDENMEKEKTFMENAKDFMSALKDDYADRNKDILERKKARDKETQELYDSVKTTWAEIKTEMGETGKELFKTVTTEFETFSKSVLDGSANLAQKMELEKHMTQLKFFMEKAGQKGIEGFSKLSTMVSNKMAEYENEGKKKID